MKFAIRYTNTGPYSEPKNAVSLVQAAERTGFESAWTVEHVLIPPTHGSTYPYSSDGRLPIGAQDNLPDPLMWMMYCAAQTTTLKFGTAVMILPIRHPIRLAKEAATFDYLTSGRLMLGVGVGWLEEEYDALGYNFKDRGRRMDEYIRLMRHAWGADDFPRSSEYDLTGLNVEPKPAQASVPLHIGGDTAVAAKRAGRLGDGYFPARGLTPELVEVMKRAADEADRDASAIELTVSMPEHESELESLAAMGVSRVAVPVTGEAGLPSLVDSPDALESWGDLIEKYADL